MIYKDFLFWLTVAPRGIVQILFARLHTYTVHSRTHLNSSVDQDLYQVHALDSHCSFQSLEPLVGDPIVGNGESRVLLHCPYYMRAYRLCVLLLCGRVLASCIYRSLAAGSLVCSVILVCVPRETFCWIQILCEHFVLSGADGRFTARSLRVAAGSLSLDFCGIVLATALQCI